MTQIEPKNQVDASPATGEENAASEVDQPVAFPDTQGGLEPGDPMPELAPRTFRVLAWVILIMVGLGLVAMVAQAVGTLSWTR